MSAWVGQSSASSTIHQSPVVGPGLEYNGTRTRPLAASFCTLSVVDGPTYTPVQTLKVLHDANHGHRSFMRLHSGTCVMCGSLFLDVNLNRSYQTLSMLAQSRLGTRLAIKRNWVGLPIPENICWLRRNARFYGSDERLSSVNLS